MGLFIYWHASPTYSIIKKKGVIRLDKKTEVQ